MPCPGALGGLFSSLLPAAPPWRPGPEPALAWLALLFAWYCYRVGSERALAGPPGGGRPAPSLPPGPGGCTAACGPTPSGTRGRAWGGQGPGPGHPEPPRLPAARAALDPLLPAGRPALGRRAAGAGLPRHPAGAPGFSLHRRGAGCPRTFLSANRFGNAGFSVLQPGTVLPGRYGPSDVRVCCHLGLKVPPGCELVGGGEPQCWPEGHCLLLDDSFLHTTTHNAKRMAG
ncbi:unnamed protein product, partial [Caretta caretta]